MIDFNKCADALIDEVLNLFASDRLLNPLNSFYDKRVFPCYKKTIIIRVCSLQEYVRDIDARNPRSKCQALDEGPISFLEEMVFFLGNYDMFGTFETINARFSVIQAMLGSNVRIRRLAEAAIQYCPDTIEFSDIHDHIAGRVGVLGKKIVDARIITMGRRYGITEAIFTAFCDGLLPYGWDIETRSVVCVRPPG